MMFRCDSCGHLFKKWDQAVWIEPHGEVLSGCPVCHDSCTPVFQCRECEEWFDEDEIHDGLCADCLRKAIDFDVFLQYCDYKKSEQFIEGFVMLHWFDMDCPKDVSDEFRAHLVSLFKEGTKDDSKLLEKCRDFLMDIDGWSGRIELAEWINEREGSK